MGNKGVGERACTGNDLTPAEEDQELGYYQKKKMEEHRARKQEQEKREKRTMDKLLRQVEQGTQLTADAQGRPARPQNWQIETPPPSLNFARCAALRDLAGDYRLCQ